MSQEYEQVARLLATSGILNQAAEVHGLICGQLSSGPGGVRIAPLRELLEIGEGQSALIDQLIERFAERIVTQMEADDFSFQPLLPADEEDLAQRLHALGKWCEGFNEGFLAGFGADQGRLQEETREVIDDFARIAQVDDSVDGGADEEGEEEDYMELVEYVRAAAAAVYLQNVPPPPDAQPDDGPQVLH